MGQPIEVDAVQLGVVAIFDTDRTLSGQDGMSYRRGEAQDSTTFSGQVAQTIFSTDDSVSGVYVYSNTVSVERDEDWSDQAVEAVSSAIGNFFIYYEENRS